MPRGRPPKPPTYDLHTALSLELGRDLEKLLADPFTGKAIYGAKTQLITSLIREVLRLYLNGLPGTEADLTGAVSILSSYARLGRAHRSDAETIDNLLQPDDNVIPDSKS